MILRGISKEATIELRPPRLKVLLLEKSNSTDIHGPPHAYVTMSIHSTVRNLCSRLAATVGKATPANAARIWKVEGREFDGSLYPSSRLHMDGPEILTPSDQTLEEAMIEPEDAFVVEFVENGTFIIIDPDKLPAKPNSMTIAVPPEVPPPLFSSGDDFFSQISKRGNNWSSSSSSKYASSSKSAGFYKSSGFGSTYTRNQTIQDPGTLGLGNM